ncbi:MAG: aspartyl/asparaginyl beta-hydroxylase domain-containing protein [Luteimonas sp.]|nr:aspartyl/asparaginyl beta-hydroxylase domain-containing protein [Luteimonas sp.]
MKLQVPFVQLPLKFEAEVLAAEVGCVAEKEWRPHPQGFEGNSMLPLVAVGGDPDNEAFAGAMQATPYLQQCPYLMQVMASLGATIGRSRLMRLSGHAEVTRHADQGYYWAERVRVHVPIVTQPTVRFECGDSAVNMAAGECWIFDTWRQHRVINDAVESRIHLVVDTVGGVRFWDMVAGGRPHGIPFDASGWQPRLLPAATDASADLACESVNVPIVMSPWELNAHLNFLLGEALPSPQLAAVKQAGVVLMREWSELWARYGESAAGRPAFRAALQRFLLASDGPAQSVLLRNELRLAQTLAILIGRAAIAPEAAVAMTANEQKAVGDNA